MEKNIEKKNKKAIIGRLVVRIICFAFVSLIIGTTVYKWNARSLTGNQMPTPFGYASAVVLSGSMEPTLSVDDLIIIKKCDKYNVNDVVVFQEGRSCVVHRIVAINDYEVTTKGDANNSEDKPIKLDQLRGKVIFHIPGVGRFVEVIKSPLSVIVIIVLAVFLLERSYRKEKNQEVDEIVSIKQQIEKLKKENEKITEQSETIDENNKSINSEESD